MTVSLASKFESLLDSANAERPLLSWFKRNPSVLADMFPMVRYLAADFPFGTDFVADFVGLGPFSGGWDIHFIELEPPQCTFVTKSGSPSRASLALLRLAARDSFTRFGTMNEYGKI